MKLRLSRWLFYLLLLPAVMGGCGWQGWLWWSWVSAPAIAQEPGAESDLSAGAPPEPNATVQIEIPHGTTAQQIGEDLEAVGVIRSSTAWNLWTRLKSLQDRGGGFQAGTYELAPTASMATIANQIWQGEVMQSSFTIPEGWSLRQMGEYFEAEGKFTAEEFGAAASTLPRDRHPWLPQGIQNLEGFLYPDTYQFTGQLTPEGVVNQMLDRFQQVALPLHQRAAGNTDYDLLEWVTLASIVEKEAVVDVERPTIAAVFARRLREGIPLGSDPTVEYAFGIRQTVDRPLTYAQVQQPSPYNTYINPGLPPGPIAAPGLASLEESLNPRDTDYLFFVARYDGTHIFSRTVAEHEAAKDAIDRELASQDASQSAN